MLPKINSKTIASIALFGFLVFAMGAGLFLSLRRQILRGRAATPPPQSQFTIGVNATGIVHYGACEGQSVETCPDLFPYSKKSDVDTTLSELHKMGARVIRVSVANKNISDSEAARRLDEFLTKADSYGISAIVFFINLYGDSGFNPAGTEAYYTIPWNGTHLLGHQFFYGGYKIRYEPFVKTVVSANKHHSNIYAWEIGNEMKDEESPNTLINFVNDTAATIKNIDPVHKIATGMINASHTTLSANTLYTQLPEVDIITIHAYDSARSGVEDVEWAVAHSKQAIVEESSFLIKARANLTRDEINFWRGKGASAYLQWGFLAKELEDNGNGDRVYGMDGLWHLADYDDLFGLYHEIAGPSIPLPTPTNQPDQNSPTPIGPPPTAGPTPTPACVFRASNYVINEQTNRPITDFDNKPGVYGTANESQYLKNDKPVAQFRGGKYFNNGLNYVLMENLKDSFITSVKLYYDYSKESGWTIVKKQCFDIGKKKGCPDIPTLQGKPLNIMSGLKVECGIDLEYGWVLRKNSQTTISPAPTQSGPTPTPTSGPVGKANLNLKLRFQGITAAQVAAENLTSRNMQIRIGLSGGGSLAETVYQFADFAVDDNAIWTGRVSFDNIPAGSDYKILIKGPKHLQRRICDSDPREDITGPPLNRYSCEKGKLNIVSGENSFDFSNILQLAGDTPEQDGVVNAIDVSAVISAFGQADQISLDKADFNLDGEVNGIDYDLIIGTLSVKNDEL